MRDSIQGIANLTSPATNQATRARIGKKALARAGLSWVRSRSVDKATKFLEFLSLNSLCAVALNLIV
jgi:hypothetical protein